jgi:FkbM family methyltransferase
MRRVLKTFAVMWRRTRWLVDFLRRRDVERRAHLVTRYLQLRLLEEVAPSWRRPLRVLGYELSYPDVTSLRWVFGEIFINRDYAPPEGMKVRHIIDAGANVGVATIFFRDLYPDAEIVCFEPDPRAFAYLKHNLETNGIQRVTAHNIGLAESRQRGQLYVNPKGPGTRQSVSRSFADAVLPGEEPLELDIELAPLSDYVDRSVDVLKLDVEGSELATLRGAGDALRLIRSVFMEYHRVPEAPLHEILELLASAGHEYELLTPVPAELGAVAVIRSHRGAEMVPGR